MTSTLPEKPYFFTLDLAKVLFPLSSFWRRVSGDSRTQYTLHPIAFYTSNFVINVISGAISLLFVLVVLKTGDYQPNDLPSIPALSSAGVFTLLYMLASAFIFDIFTKESKISPQFKYSFWVYIFSLVWLGWLVVLVALLFLLPVFLILGCILICCILFVFILITLNSVASADLFQTLLSAYSYISSFASIFIAGVGGVYIFWIIPRKVFSHIFQRVNFPTNNLWVIILASLIIPAIPLSLCAFPFFINQLRLP